MPNQRNATATSFMRPAPNPNEDEMGQQEDRLVADPLADDFQGLWTTTARKNREVFTELFRPVPTNLVRDWKAYDVRVSVHVLLEVDLDACLSDCRITSRR
jgi:phospholipase D1/2